jgi:hypothetical protein
VSLQSFYIAACVVALMHFVRAPDPRRLPLIAMFALLSFAHHQPDTQAARPWHLAAGAAGLVQLAVLAPRPPQGESHR